MKAYKFRKLNYITVTEIVLLLCFAAFFLYVIYTGKVTMYVHPRIVLYMIICSFSLIVIALAMLKDIYKITEKAGMISLPFFIVPLAMMLILPAKPLASDIASPDRILLKRVNGSLLNEMPEISTLKDSSSDKIKSSSALAQNDVIILNENNFYRCLLEINSEPDIYEGIKIEVLGFVIFDEETPDNGIFIIARLMMLCCAADMQPVGLLCLYEGADRLQADSWVKVSGILGKTVYNGETVPCIQADSAAAIPVPKNSYIYPY